MAEEIKTDEMLGYMTLAESNLREAWRRYDAARETPDENTLEVRRRILNVGGKIVGIIKRLAFDEKKPPAKIDTDARAEAFVKNHGLAEVRAVAGNIKYEFAAIAREARGANDWKREAPKMARTRATHVVIEDEKKKRAGK